MAVTLAVAHVLIASSLGLATAADTEVTPVVDVSVIGGELTVNLRNAPLAEVLRVIGERAGFEVVIHGDLGVRVTQSLAGVPLEEGIRRLAGDHSVVVMYGTPAGGSGQSPVTGVLVMARVPARAGASSESTRSVMNPAPESPKPERADVSVPEPARVSVLDRHIAEIQRLADDALGGSGAALARLAEIGAADPEAALRQQAVAALGRLTGSAVEPVLVAALADIEADVRVRAVRGLRRQGTDTAVQSIIHACLADGDPQVRLAAVNALTSLPGSAMRRALTQAASDPDDVVREVAIQGLAWWNTRAPLGH